MFKRVLTVLAVTCVFTAVNASAAGEIKLCAGETAIGNIFKFIATAFQEKSGLKFEYPFDPTRGGALDNLRNLMAGKCEGAVNGGNFENSMQLLVEAKISPDRGKFTYRVIGRDRTKIVVHPSLDIPEVSDEGLAGLLSGKIGNWKEVGGPSLPVKLVIAQRKPATNKAVQLQVLPGTSFSSQSVKVETWEDAVSEVAKTPGAMTFMAGNVDSKGLKVLRTHMELGRPLTLITMGKPTAEMQKLISFIGNEGAKLIPR